MIFFNSRYPYSFLSFFILFQEDLRFFHSYLHYQWLIFCLIKNLEAELWASKKMQEVRKVYFQGEEEGLIYSLFPCELLFVLSLIIGVQ
jgi:hypothetical protein